MPNVNAPFGFIPTRHLMGGVIRMREYRLAAATANAIFNGDVVKLLNTGYADRAAGGDTNLLGIMAGVRWTDTDGTPRWSPYWPAAQATKGSGDAFISVYDDPNIAYRVQCKTGTAFALTHVGNNADFEYSAGNTSTGRSAGRLDISAAGAGAANFRILQLFPIVGNDFGDSAIVEVRFNEHLLLSTSGI